MLEEVHLVRGVDCRPAAAWLGHGASAKVSDEVMSHIGGLRKGDPVRVRVGATANHALAVVEVFLEVTLNGDKAFYVICSTYVALGPRQWVKSGSCSCLPIRYVLRKDLIREDGAGVVHSSL